MSNTIKNILIQKTEGYSSISFYGPYPINSYKLGNVFEKPKLIETKYPFVVEM